MLVAMVLIGEALGWERMYHNRKGLKALCLGRVILLAAWLTCTSYILALDFVHRPCTALAAIL